MMNEVEQGMMYIITPLLAWAVLVFPGVMLVGAIPDRLLKMPVFIGITLWGLLLWSILLSFAGAFFLLSYIIGSIV